MALYAFDGTWQDSSAPAHQRDPHKDTNVKHFFEQYQGEKYYKDGVGTRGPFDRIVGGVMGVGAKRRIEEQFEALKHRYKSGDQDIDIVGYSRGAAMARMFVARLGREFRNLNLDRPPPVRFLGLFDTVASFGNPWDDKEHAFKREIPKFVDHTFHAMALDESRETFGIERCLGDRRQITEVWFRGGHGDIGGNPPYTDEYGTQTTRSEIALRWLLAKAGACGLPVDARAEGMGADHSGAPVSAGSELIRLGNVGTLSRRIHVGDLVHHTVEGTDLTRGIDGRSLRRIAVLTRIEDQDLESQHKSIDWGPPLAVGHLPDNFRVAGEDHGAPSLVHLSLRRYPFDVLPARTWKAWLKLWKIANPPDIGKARMDEFWAPTPADRALAWEIYVELQTRIAVQALGDDEGDDTTALTSIYTLFPFSRQSMQRHGVACANAAALVAAFLNQKLRPFTAKWHKRSVEEQWDATPGANHPEFRAALRELQPVLTQLASALSHLADARI